MDNKLSGFSPTRLFALFLSFVLTFSLVLTSAYASTPEYAYIETTLSDTWEIKSSVKIEKVTSNGTLPEGKRLSPSMLSGLASNTASFSEADGSVSATASSDNLLLTFPGHKGDGDKKGSGNVRANEISDRLILDLNETIGLAWSATDRVGWSRDDYVAHMNELMSAVSSGGTVGNVTISTSASGLDMSKIDDKSLDKSDFVCVTDKNGNNHYMCWRMSRGYYASGSREQIIYDETASASNEAEFVTWRVVVFEALQNSSLAGDSKVGVSDVYGSGFKIGDLIARALSVAVESLKSILKLWSVDELVFNRGSVRGTDAYVHGIFPSGWEPLIWSFFAIFELFALLTVLYSIVTIVIRRSFATANRLAMMRAWETVKDLISVVIILSILPMFLQAIMTFSSSLTTIFYSALGEDAKSVVSVRNQISADSGTIAGCVLQIVYLGMDIYFNFFYALRALTVALMIIIAPICVVSLTFDNNLKNITSEWIRELLANVFIQPVQALILTIVLLLPSTGHGFDSVIMMYAVIPITSVVRNMFFGNGGNIIDRTANRAKTAAMATTALAGKTVWDHTGGKLVNRYERKLDDKIGGGLDKFDAGVAESKESASAIINRSLFSAGESRQNGMPLDGHKHSFVNPSSVPKREPVLPELDFSTLGNGEIPFGVEESDILNVNFNNSGNAHGNHSGSNFGQKPNYNFNENGVDPNIG